MAKPKCTCTICGSQFAGIKSKANLYCGMPCYRVAQRRGDYKRGSERIGQCTHCQKAVIGKSKTRCRDGRKADNLFCDRRCYDEYRAEIRARLKKPCKHCGTVFQPHNKSTLYCSWDCRAQDRKAKPKNCLSCGCLFTPIKWHEGYGGMVSHNSGKTCSPECYNAWFKDDPVRKDKISKAFTGKNHPNWQGGPQFKHRGARGAGWQRARRAALQRDKHVCQDCGITQDAHIELTGKGLEVHHKRPFWQFNGDNAKANALSNLVSLCKSCHQKADWAYRKANPVQMGLTIT